MVTPLEVARFPAGVSAGGKSLKHVRQIIALSCKQCACTDRLLEFTVLVASYTEGRMCIRELTIPRYPRLLQAAALAGAMATASLANAIDFPALHPNDAKTRTGYERFYNMDYERAIPSFERAMAQNPQDPFTANNLANAYLIRELYRMGALNPADYANDNFVGTPKRPGTAEAKRKIKELLETATQLEEERLHGNEKDVDALYARGVTRAMRSSYTGLIDRSWITALRSAVGSRRDHEHVLEMNRDYVDAKLIVGAHDFIVGSLPWAVKAAASLVGFSGDKKRGIEELYAVSRGGSQTSVDAKILLALFLRREGRIDESLTLVRGLTQSFPQNVILALEEGDLLRVAHRDKDALTVYRRVWDAGHAGHFPFGNYELACIDMGDVQRAAKDDQEALTSYNLMDEVTKPDPELKQRADLNAGEIYDLQHKRELAVKKYQAVLAVDQSTEFAKSARKYLKDGYR